jgi:hypothetical protein
MKKPALTLEMIIQKGALRQISGGQNKARESQFWTRNAAWFATSHDFQCPFLFLLFRCSFAFQDAAHNPSGFIGVFGPRNGFGPLVHDEPSIIYVQQRWSFIQPLVHKE